MENNQTVVTTITTTEAAAACWPVPATATENVKEFLSKYYPGGLVYLHNGFLGYSGGYWVELDEQADILCSITAFFGPGVVSQGARTFRAC